MFTLTTKDLFEMQNTLKKLADCSDYPDWKVSYNIMRLTKKLKPLIETKLAALGSLQKQWIAKIDPKTNEITPVEGKTTVEMEEAFKTFMEEKLEVEWHRVKLQDLAAAKLSPNELGTVAPIVVTMDVL